ncbi:cupin domain-containing protein [Bacillus tuaregi]|uniref:cupin domain-containing protein n=1 Tax=Bacillus tuaregi TaxID=1816695 RepID=UPI0008F8F71D|nr:cupin domain-containing protein [Bacillus tuaregi]
MYYGPYIYPYQYPYDANAFMYYYGRQLPYWPYPNEIEAGNRFDSFRSYNGNDRNSREDYGPKPFTININQATKQNNTFRTALWTGTQLQITLMSLKRGEDIGLEMHPDVDQFLRVEQGQGLVQMGKSRDQLTFRRRVYDDSAIVIPAGTWHNLINTGNGPLKLYSIYAPPNHPFGTVHETKSEAEAAEEGHHSS